MPNVLEPPPYGFDLHSPYGAFDPRNPISSPNGQSGKALEPYLSDVVYPRWIQEEQRLKALARWMQGKQPFTQRVARRDMEKQALLELSRSPWLGLAVNIYSQAMYVDGYRAPGSKENASPWKSWQQNNMQAMQMSVHRDAIGFGYAFVRVLPGTDPLTGKERAFMRGITPKRCYALYEDPVSDEFPQFALELLPDNMTFRWYTNEVYHEYHNPGQGGSFQYTGTTEHNMGVVPIVRYINQMDLDGRCVGDVEQMIGVAARIDKTVYDRLLVQHYNSWKIRWATGLEQADDDEGVERDKRTLAQEDMLVSSDPNAKFGSLAETALAPFLDAYNTDVESLASMEQLPSHLFTGKVINVSAEALAASRAQTTQKLIEKQTSMGVSHARMMRLAALIDGDAEAAQDYEARVSWQDVEVRSLAQAADAYGKIATQLGVPKQFLWRFIPGFDSADVEEMQQHALDNDPLTEFLRDVLPTQQGAGAHIEGSNRSGETVAGGRSKE